MNHLTEIFNYDDICVKRQKYSSGCVKSEKSYKEIVCNNNVSYIKTGIWKYYNDNFGNPLITKIENYENDVLNGKTVLYHPDGRTVYTSTDYKDGVASGKMIVNSIDGVLMHSSEFENGARHGIIRHFYDDGVLKTYSEYIRDFLHNNIEYTPEGSPISNSHYIHVDGIDYMHGRYNTYHTNNSIKLNTTYSYNQINGVYEEFYDNGQLKEKSNYSMGEPVGESLLYDSDGEIVETTYFGVDNTSSTGDTEDFVQEHPTFIDTIVDTDHVLSCKVCFNNKSCIAAICGHMLCGTCSIHIFKSSRNECPICRNEWTDLRKIYF